MCSLPFYCIRSLVFYLFGWLAEWAVPTLSPGWIWPVVLIWCPGWVWWGPIQSCIWGQRCSLEGIRGHDLALTQPCWGKVPRLSSENCMGPGNREVGWGLVLIANASPLLYFLTCGEPCGMDAWFCRPDLACGPEVEHPCTRSTWMPYLPCLHIIKHFVYHAKYFLLGLFSLSFKGYYSKYSFILIT